MKAGFANSFSTGLLAGAQLAQMKHSQERDDQIWAWKQQDRDREQQARDSYEQINRDFYTGQGDFAGQQGGAPIDPTAAAKADASYDRVEQQRLGVPIQQPTGLSMTQQETNAANGVKPYTDPQRQALYYQKLKGWAQTHLAPERAMEFIKNADAMQESGYQQKQVQVFRALASGDKTGFDQAAQLFSSQMPAGYQLDTSHAIFDGHGGWSGVAMVNPKSGDVRPVPADHDSLAQMFNATTPAQALATSAMQRKESRADQEIGLKVDAGKRADRELAQKGALIDAQAAHLAADTANDKARIGIAAKNANTEAARLGIAKDELELRKDAAKGDEKAKDMLLRQSAFEREFGYKAPKRDPLTTSPEIEAADQARQQAGQQMSAIASEIYGRSAEGIKAGERNAVHSETSAFMRQFGNGTLDASKLKDNGDGTVKYGRLVVPADLMAHYKPSAKPPGITGSY